MPGLYQDEPKSLMHRFHRGTTTTKNFNFSQFQHTGDFTDSSSRRSPQDRKRFLGKKGDPPQSASKNTAVLPVLEDFEDSTSSLEPIAEEEHKAARPVPPLQISQLHQFQQQVYTPSNTLPQTASSVVMTSYLNIPHGLFNSTHANSRGASVQPAPNFKLNFVPHTTSKRP